eukprot:jgi/Mesvir1/11924/Mv00261-RA.1
MNPEEKLQTSGGPPAPAPAPVAPSFLSVCFGSGLKIFDIIVSPLIWIMVSVAWTRMMQIDQEEETVKTVLVKSVPFFVQLLITCVIFVPGFVRAGLVKGLLAFLLVNYVRFNVANVYAMLFTRSLESEDKEIES